MKKMDSSFQCCLKDGSRPTAYTDADGVCKPPEGTDAKGPGGEIYDGSWLKAVVTPNPGETEFTLTLSDNSNKPVEVRVIDMYGRSVHYARGSANQSYKFGQQFAGGVCS